MPLESFRTKIQELKDTLPTADELQKMRTLGYWKEKVRELSVVKKRRHERQQREVDTLSAVNLRHGLEKFLAAEPHVQSAVVLNRRADKAKDHHQLVQAALEVLLFPQAPDTTDFNGKYLPPSKSLLELLSDLLRTEYREKYRRAVFSLSDQPKPVHMNIGHKGKLENLYPDQFSKDPQRLASEPEEPVRRTSPHRPQETGQQTQPPDAPGSHRLSTLS